MSRPCVLAVLLPWGGVRPRHGRFWIYDAWRSAGTACMACTLPWLSWHVRPPDSPHHAGTRPCRTSAACCTTRTPCTSTSPTGRCGANSLALACGPACTHACLGHALCVAVSTAHAFAWTLLLDLRDRRCSTAAGTEPLLAWAGKAARAVCPRARPWCGSCRPRR